MKITIKVQRLADEFQPAAAAGKCANCNKCGRSGGPCGSNCGGNNCGGKGK